MISDIFCAENSIWLTNEFYYRTGVRRMSNEPSLWQSGVFELKLAVLFDWVDRQVLTRLVLIPQRGGSSPDTGYCMGHSGERCHLSCVAVE